MRILNRQTSLLQASYFFVYIILSFVIILTPILITRSIAISESIIIDEEIVEVILLGILFGLSVLIHSLYRREVKEHKEVIRQVINDSKTVEGKLVDLMSYVGKVNVQIEEIKSVFNTSNIYPETPSDFKKTFRFLSERTLGIVNTDWALFRIINSTSQRTMSECFETRHGISCNYPHVSNKMILEKQNLPHFTTVISNPSNLDIVVCCTMPIDTISEDQRIFILAIINEIIMLFIILNSSYYKNENKTLLAGETASRNAMNF